MITVFTPSYADDRNTNAQNLTVKEVVARMDPSRFRVVMLGAGVSDPRIAGRSNTRVLPWRKHGNTARILLHLLTHVPDAYFFPREGPLDAAFLAARASLRLRSALVTYVVSGGLSEQSDRPILMRAIREGEADRPEPIRPGLPRIAQQLYTRIPIYPEVEVLTLSFSLQRMREWLGPDDLVVPVLTQALTGHGR